MDPQTLNEIVVTEAAEPVEILRLGKDEMNFAEFPITLLTDRVPKGKTTIRYQDKIFDERANKLITRKLTISADESNGLPTAVDDDVILGLIQLTKIVNNFTSREVEFNRMDLIRTLGWPDSGDSYRRLATSLKRWLSVTLLYENAWRDNRQGAWTTKGFHILDNIELNDGRTVGVHGEPFPSRIIWNKVVFESFQAGYLKSIDYNLYVKLKHSTTRRLYRFLSKRMYFGPELSFDLRDLGISHVGLSDSYRGNAGKIKEKLKPALDELEEVGFLQSMSRDERYLKTGKTWQIRLICRAASPSLPASCPAKQEPTPGVTELAFHGVTPTIAAELVTRHPADYIATKIEILVWLLERKDKRVARNSAGWLVKAITDDYAAPKGFETSAKRKELEAARLEADRIAVEESRRNRSVAARERAQDEAVAAYRRSLTPEQVSQLEANAIAQASEEMRRNLDEPAMKSVKKTLISGLVKEHIVRLMQAGNLAAEPA